MWIVLSDDLDKAGLDEAADPPPHPRGVENPGPVAASMPAFVWDSEYGSSRQARAMSALLAYFGKRRVGLLEGVQ